MRERRSALILLGPPGSGKTVIADKLASSYGVTVLKTGELLREEVKRGTPLGAKLEPFLESGRLASSDLVADVLKRAIQQVDQRVILFDGFPRREDQIDLFFRIGKEVGVDLSAVLVLCLPRSLAVKRLIGRRLCPNCGAAYNVYFNPPARPGICDRCGAQLEQRQDDAPEVVNRRLETYGEDTLPVINYFKVNYPHITHLVSTEKPIDQVLDSVLSILRDKSLIPP